LDECDRQAHSRFSRSIERGFWSNAIFQFSDHIKVIFQPPPSLLAIFLIFAGILLLQGLQHRMQRVVGGIWHLSDSCAMSFMDIPFALVGGAYIIMAAFIVRSLPASVRAGVASLQQIDPSIEEASNILGADAQYTFRKVTLPLILPALVAGIDLQFYQAYDEPFCDHLSGKRKMENRDSFDSERMGAGRGQHCGCLLDADYLVCHDCHCNFEFSHQTLIPRSGRRGSQSRT
jgi:hypothetical protein